MSAIGTMLQNLIEQPVMRWDSEVMKSPGQQMWDDVRS